MNPTDIAGWTALAVTLVAVVVIGFGARRTGYGLLLASLVTGIAALAIDGTSSKWTLLYGVIVGWAALQFGKELRKGGAK